MYQPVEIKCEHAGKPELNCVGEISVVPCMTDSDSCPYGEHIRVSGEGGAACLRDGNKPLGLLEKRTQQVA